VPNARRALSSSLWSSRNVFFRPADFAGMSMGSDTAERFDFFADAIFHRIQRIRTLCAD
jgi:hypothetical protein